MTFGVWVRIAISIGIAVFIVTCSQQKNKRAACKDLKKVRTSDWEGWIEIDKDE